MVSASGSSTLLAAAISALGAAAVGDLRGQPRARVVHQTLPADLVDPPEFLIGNAVDALPDIVIGWIFRPIAAPGSDRAPRSSPAEIQVGVWMPLVT